MLNSSLNGDLKLLVTLVGGEGPSVGKVLDDVKSFSVLHKKTKTLVCPKD
jgi:hypothetical protein